MNYILKAKYVHVGEDGDVLTISFADDEIEPRQYVFLQKALNPDAQDKKLGMDKMHVEIEDQSRSGYGGIAKMRYTNGELVIMLTDRARKFLRVDGDIKIAFPSVGDADENMLAKLVSVSNGIFEWERG